MAFFIFPLLSARDLDIGPEGFSPIDDISRGLMTRAIWKRPCINIFITYFARADNMLLPFTRGQKTCYCPRKMLWPRGQITRRKLCFYYTCKFGVISIKHVIRYVIKVLDMVFNVTFPALNVYISIRWGMNIPSKPKIWHYSLYIYFISSVHAFNWSLKLEISQGCEQGFETRVTRRISLTEQKLLTRSVWLHPQCIVGFMLVNQAV